MRFACRVGRQSGGQRLIFQKVTDVELSSRWQYLETEAIHIMREVAGEFERPALLFPAAKIPSLLRLAEKAFRPADIPMPFLNVKPDTSFPS